MKRIRLRPARAFQAAALAAVMSMTLISPGHAAVETGAVTLPSPPLPVATIAGEAIVAGQLDREYEDDQVFPVYRFPSAISADGNTIAYGGISTPSGHSGSTTYGNAVLNRKTGTKFFLDYQIVAGLSEDGSKVVYYPGCADCYGGLFVKDLTTGAVTRVDQPKMSDYNPVDAATFDGSRTVVFRSELPLLPSAGPNNMYFRDVVTGVTGLLKDPQAPQPTTYDGVGYGGVSSAISPGGRFIAFTWKMADGKSAVSVYDQVTGQYTRVTSTNRPESAIGGISNGGKLTFTTTDQLVPEDTNTVADAYIRDLVNGTVTLASTDESGAATGTDESSRTTITADGHYMIYRRPGTNGERVFWNLTTGAKRVLTGMDGTATSLGWGVLSRNGRYLLSAVQTETGRWGIGLRDQAQDCAGDFVTGSGSGTLYGSPVDDVLYGSPGPDTINGGGGNDVICGLGGDDVIDGGLGDDAVYGGAGDDRIEGNEGNDVVEGGVGADSMNGGAGTDALLYRYATAGVDVSLNRVTPNGMPGEGDQVFNDFEWIYGSIHNDTLSGRENGEKLVGLAGDDLLLGMDGNDELWGGDGHDVLVGMAGDDYLNGGPGPSDSCAGGPGTNTFGDCKFTSNSP
ncbi:hypothetical protein [Planotetraspora sp. GP83]|uniref:hypothetical protein n=1 Tax=Planotetraspora sp. GP83 TaxID=3156264 RepID=UPI003518F50A